MSRAGEAGRRAEQAARDYLTGLGYTIREANFRTRFGEVDIVAEKDDWLVFIEVRGRRAGSSGGSSRRPGVLCCLAGTPPADAV